MKLGKPIKYLAVPPGEVIERVKKKVKEEMASKEKLINEIKGSEILTELITLFTQGVEMIEPSDLTASVKGKDNIYNHFQLMLSSATESVELMTWEVISIVNFWVSTFLQDLLICFFDNSYHPQVSSSKWYTIRCLSFLWIA
mgnify:CR=1 FL=1